MTFSINLTAPMEAYALTTTQQNSGRPTFQWEAVPDATWYEVWVGTPAPEFGTQHHAWYSARQLGCHNLMPCTLTADMNLQDGAYTWFLRSWGPGGMSIGGADGWIEQQAFTVNSAPAIAPSSLTPTGDSSMQKPVFSWSSVQDASWYHVEVFSSEDTMAVYDMWHSAEQLQCSSLSCTLEITSTYLAPGSYGWRVTAYTPKGVGPASENHPFTIGY